MPSILLTSGNIVALKAALRRELPTQKSSHLSEALAFGLGSRTHAALIAAMNSAPKPMLAAIDLARISDRLSELAGAGASLDFLAAVVRSPMLPDRIWIAVKNGDSSANSDWFYECRKRGIPMVFIEMRRKYARLNWDCITIDPSEEGHLQHRAGNYLGDLMFETFQTMAKNASGKPLFNASSFVGSVDRLQPELAYGMADRFFGMLYRPMIARLQAA